MGQARRAGYITANHAALDWQDAAALLMQGKAANYVMGNFAVAVFKEGGMTNDTLGFMAVPGNHPGYAARRRSADRHDPHSGRRQNVEDAKKFLAFIARRRPDQAERGSGPVADQQGARSATIRSSGRFRDAVDTPGGIAQFFDRDAPAEMAKVGMEGFQQFMVQPDQLDNILERLEKARQRIYK
jgi:multiple sugar transport system substrate-binding protein